MARVLLLDLDDTLYDERTYVLSGFRAVATEVACLTPSVDPRQLFQDMVAELDTNGRGKVFDRALEQAGLAPVGGLVQTLVKTYREHRPDIALWPGVADALADLARDHRLAVVTDGLPLMQRRKAEALDLARHVEEVLVCWEHEAPKPDPACYIEALRRLEGRPEDAIVIGDNPDHDMAAAKAIGARSIRVMTGRFSNQTHSDFAPDAVAARFVDVPRVLRGQLGAAA